jgi:hypothetical protein
MNEEILNTRGDQAFYMGAENAKIESAEKSAETGGHHWKYATQPGHEEINCPYSEPRIFRTTSWKIHRWYVAINQF